jgi:carboxyl-terminal processing protease
MRLLSILLVVGIFLAGAPATQAQACTPDSPTPGVGVVREAYDLISARFVEPVPSSTLLPAGATAVVAEVRRSRPAAELADAEAWFIGDPGFSWGRFAERYCLAWEARGESLPPETLAYATIRAMAASVREAHTGFLTPEQYRDHVAWTSTGEVRYEGIGVRLRNEPLRVDYVFAGGPAEAAGLRAGDEILLINGALSREMTPAAAAIALRGEAGSRVRLTIRRADVPAPWEVELTRARISIPSTESRIMDGVGYLNIRGFPRPALYDEVATELAWLNAVGAQALVLDLRGNAGGRLDVGANVAGLFLPDAAPLYRETTRVGQVTRRSVPSQALWTKPLVVLIDEGTASMGEILAAAIQEQKIAQVIGTRTAGAVAGSLVLPLSDGSAVQVTVVRIDSGLGQVLNNIGVQPDIEIRTAPSPARNDEPLDAAVGMLRARIAPPQTATAPVPTSAPSPTSVPTPSPVPTPGVTPTAS